MEESHINFGVRDIWNEWQPFGINRTDLTRHVFVIGQTGVGKTTLLKTLFMQSVMAGEGAGILDPHGDVASELLDLIPRRRVEDVIYFDPSDEHSAPAFNMLADVPVQMRHLVCSGLVSAMRSLFAASWGPRTEYLLVNCLMALMEVPDATLLGLPRLLTDEKFRQWVLTFVRDPVIGAFWRNEFARMEPRFRQEVTAPLQNKIGQVLVNPQLRRIFGTVRNRIDLRHTIDHRKIFIGNLSKGRLGEEGSNLMGSLLLALFQHAAMSRANIPESERQNYLLLVDEMPNFTTDAIAAGLAENRKYKLSLGLFAQHTDQLSEKVHSAVFGNVGSMISFRVSENDASLLSRQYGGFYPPEVFTSLDNFEVVARLSSHGKQLQPFMGRTVQPLERPCARRERIIRRSQQRYCNDSDVVDEKIARWMKRRNWGSH